MQKKLGSYTLLIDAGNSWIKWGLCLDQKTIVAQGKCLPQKLESELKSLVQQYQIKCIGSCSVRGTEFTTQLKLLCLSLNLPEPRFMKVSDGSHLLKNNYGDPNKLGIDRWMAALAAAQLTATSCVVIDAGTAITIDLVDANQHYLGGVIIPGLHLSATALNVTANIQWGKGGETTYFNKLAIQNTQDGISAGVQQMISGGIRYMLENARREIGEETKIVACGGDWPILAPHMVDEISYHPSLVLDGILIGLNQ